MNINFQNKYVTYPTVINCRFYVAFVKIEWFNCFIQ